MTSDTSKISQANKFASPSGNNRTKPVKEPRSLKHKLTIGLLAVYFISSLGTVFAQFFLSRVEDKLANIDLLNKLSQMVLETRRYEKNYLLYNNNDDLQKARDYLKQVNSELKHLRSVKAFPKHNLPVYEKKLEDYANSLRTLTFMENSSQRKDLEERVHLYGHIFTTYVIEQGDTLREEITFSSKQARILSQTILLLALFSGIFLTIYLIRRIVSPLEFICRAASRITEGELSVIPMVPEPDRSREEIELVDSLNHMLRFLESKQNQLVQSAKLATIGKVTAGIAHEINNPLNNIYLTAEVLLEDLPDMENAERLGMINDILDQADRAREVVHHLLAFSRSRQVSIVDNINLANLVKQCLRFLKNQIRINQITVHTEIPELSISVNGNANQLQQVLVNVILNSIQAMGPGGLLYIKVSEKSKEMARIEIKDNGPGIPEEAKARIFDPFFTTKSDGTGLGLSVSNSIIEEHGGIISLDSEQGKGTIFYIDLPIVRPMEEP